MWHLLDLRRARDELNPGLWHAPKVAVTECSHVPSHIGSLIEWASAQVPPTLPLGRAQPAKAPSARPKRSGTACKKGPKKSRKLRLGGCLTVPSKPTKKTRQGLAARALQQAQEQLRHGQGAASQGALR